MSGTGAFKTDPGLKAHIALLRLFAALLEYKNSANTNRRGSFSSSEEGDDDGDEGRRGSLASSRIPDLQDPLSLIGLLRSCFMYCGVVGGAERKRGGTNADGGAKGRALSHLSNAKKLLKQAAGGLPENASVAGYRAAMKAAESGEVAALQQLARFINRNPGSVKGHALNVRLMEMNFRYARNRYRREKKQGNEEDSGAEEEGGGGREQRDKRGEVAACGFSDRLLLARVARARALRDWLETDPLEPRAVLGLAALHTERSGAVVGIADKAFVTRSLIEQLETHGFPRPCPSSFDSTSAGHGRASIVTTRSATALWGALADLLGGLRLRDEPVPLLRTGEGGRISAAAMAPPVPGTIWDRLYGADPPWSPTDFQRLGDSNLSCGSSGSTGWQRTEDRQLLTGAPPTPHPLLRGVVDRELWEETLLDPSGDQLLQVATGTAMVAAMSEGAVGEDENIFYCRFVGDFSFFY